MNAKVLNICFIAAILPCLTLASSYASCTSAEQCKITLKHEVKMSYFEAFKNMMKEILHSIENAAQVVETGLQKDDPNQAQLKEIKNATHQDLESLNKEAALTDESLLNYYKNSWNYWRKIRTTAKEQRDIKSQKDRAENAAKKIFKILFDTWISVGKLKGDVVVPGFEELDRDVQRVKDLPLTDENMEIIIRTFARIMNFFELGHLNIFNYM